MQIRSVFLLCVILLFSAPFLYVKHVIGASDVLPICNPIFTLGTMDKSDAEFNRLGFGDIQEIEIDAAGIVDPTMIPPRLIHPDGDFSPIRWDSVKEITINFKVLDERNNLILRLARAGDSDTLVKVDNSIEYRVSADMLGSDEGPKFGAYDLHLGTLEKGNHKISLTMPDDGLGFNGTYRWDAIMLCRE